MEIYDVSAVLVAIKNEIEREPRSRVLMQAISEL